MHIPPPAPSRTLGEALSHYLQKFYLELILLLFIVVYVVNYFTGKRANDLIAVNWLQTNRELLEQNFAHLGFEEESGTKLE